MKPAPRKLRTFVRSEAAVVVMSGLYKRRIWNAVNGRIVSNRHANLMA
jgi:hypothetical protein